MAKLLRFPNLNSITLTGRLTRDVELRYTPSGDPVASLPIAFSKNYRDADGNWQQKSYFIDVVVWRKSAENCAQNLSKGSAVLVEGELQTRIYTTKDNQNRKVVEINGRRVLNLERDESSGEYNKKPDTKIEKNIENSFSESETTDEDIPF